MQTAQRKSHVIVALLLIVTVAVLSAAGIASVRTAQENAYADATFTKADEVKIAHITDMHYFPLNYCYQDLSDKAAAYHTEVASSMKMVLESSRYNVAALDNILAEMPDYLVVTGDMTLNGEIQGHIEVANLLRRLQNKVRAAGKPNFQVFVIMGNHDMYNDKAYSWRDGSAHFVANNTRVDVTKIYSSLGYPDLTDEEIGAYYDSIVDAYAGLSPYEADATGSSPEKGMSFVNSTLATDGFTYSYMYRLNGSETLLEENKISDYANGDLSYVVECPDDYVFIAVDEELSNTERQHHLGAILYDSFADYLTAQKADGKFDGKTLIGFQHHNLLPHFTGEESLLKDFTVYNYEEFADFYADLGMRYVYSGHMHANDIEYRVSLNGNPLTDIETASSTGYGAATRITRIERGNVGKDYAENFYSKLVRVDGVDLAPIFDAGLMDNDYLIRFGLDKFVKSDKTISDSSEYAGTKLFYNILENVVFNSYVNVDFIGGLGTMVAGILPDSGAIGSALAGIKASVPTIVNNLIRHIENVTLKDYVYNGNRAEFKSNKLGAKLCGYAEDLIYRAVELKVNSDGDTLIDFVLGAYLKHVGGFDLSYADASDGVKEALNGFANGAIIKELIGVLLDENSGLMPIVKGLFDPIDLGYGLSSKDKKSINGLLTILAGEDAPEISLDAFMLDDVIPVVLSFLETSNILSFDMKGMGGKEFIDDIIESYVTDAFYTSLGEIAHNIVYAFSIDETADMENVVGKYVLYNPAALTASYVSGEIENVPDAERGMLPSMLQVTFGEDPASDKNFVWFTDKRISGTQIQYCEGEFDEANAYTISGKTEIYVTTTANIDLGIFATLMHVEIARHTVELKGLMSSTAYSYRVGDKSKGYWSEIYTFTTAPSEDEPFEILLMTDIQGSSSKPYTQAAAIMEKVNSVFANGYDFVINCGDVVDNSRNLTQWKFLDILADYWANTTVVVASGNHDKYKYEAPDMSKVKTAAEYSWLDKNSVKSEYSYLLLHYNLSYPAQDDSSGAYYSFDYSAVHFTVLNTNNLGYNGLADEQYDWLIDDLDQTDKKFKVVIMHKGLYSAGSHIEDSDVIALREQLTEVFADKGVALVLQGHDHTYSESYYVDREGNVIRTNANATTALGGVDGGVMYVALGTFGDKFYNYVAGDDMPLAYGKDLHNPTLVNPTFGKLTFDGENLYYTGYEYDLENDEIVELRGADLTLGEQIIVVSCVAVGVSVLAIALAMIRKAAAKRK